MSVLVDNQFHAVAYAFSAAFGYLFEQSLHLFAGKRNETHLVFERSHVDNVAARNVSFDDGRAQTANVVNAKLWLLAIALSGPNKNVGHEVG